MDDSTSNALILLFGIVGHLLSAVLVVIFLVHFFTRFEQAKKLCEQYPFEPWKWNPDWLDGKGAYRKIWFVFAVLPFGIGMSAALIVQAWNEEPFLQFIALIIPAAISTILIAGIRVFIAWLSLRHARCELIDNPGELGKPFRCTITVPPPSLLYPLPVNVRVRCMEVKRVIKRRFVSEVVAVSCDLSRSDFRENSDGTLSAEINMDVPASGIPTTPDSEGQTRLKYYYFWTLSHGNRFSLIPSYIEYQIPIFSPIEH